MSGDLKIRSKIPNMKESDFNYGKIVMIPEGC